MTVQQTPLAASMIITKTTHEGIKLAHRRALPSASVVVDVAETVCAVAPCVRARFVSQPIVLTLCKEAPPCLSLTDYAATNRSAAFSY